MNDLIIMYLLIHVTIAKNIVLWHNYVLTSILLVASSLMSFWLLIMSFGVVSMKLFLFLRSCFAREGSISLEACLHHLYLGSIHWWCLRIECALGVWSCRCRCLLGFIAFDFLARDLIILFFSMFFRLFRLVTLSLQSFCSFSVQVHLIFQHFASEELLSLD